MGRALRVVILSVLMVVAGGLLPVHAEPIKVATVGDSITQGVSIYNSHGNGCTSCGGYQPRLKTLLNAHNGESNTVYNYGISGETSNNGAARIPGIISSKNPAYVLYMEGTNDLIEVSPSTVAARVEIAMNNILAQGKVAVIGTLIPDLKYAPKPDQKGVPETNGYIRSMVSQKAAAGSEIYLAELHDEIFWSYQTTMSGDGIHPSQAGYNEMADVWFAVMEELLLQTAFLPAIYLLLQ